MQPNVLLWLHHVLVTFIELEGWMMIYSLALWLDWTTFIKVNIKVMATVILHNTS